MVKVKVADLKPGLAFSADIYGPNKSIPLLTAVNRDTNKSNLLTEAGISLLKRNGVEEIDIVLDEKGFTFPPEFTSALADTIDHFYERNEFDKLLSYARLFDTLAKDENGRWRQNFKIDTDKYVYRNENNSNPYCTAKEHIANVVNIAVALATYYNNLQYEKDIIPIEQVALAAMLSEVGRYANISSQLELIKSKYKDSDIIRNIENAIYNNNLRHFQADARNVVKPVLTKIPGKVFEEYDYKYIPLYSYLICKKFNLDSVVSRAILYSKESYSNNDGVLGVYLDAIDTPEDFKTSDDTKLGSRSVLISEIINLAAEYDTYLYNSRNECLERGIAPIFKDVFMNMNHLQSMGNFHPRLLRYLYEIVPCYYVGQLVELSDGTYGRIKKNTFDLSDPIIEDVNGNIISDDVKVIGPATDYPYVFMGLEKEETTTRKVV